MPEAERLAVHLAEFNALRAEIVNRNVIQNTLVTFTLAATGALGGFSIAPGHNRVVILLLIPLNAATGMLWLENARSIFKAGNYIKDDLWSNMRSTLGSSDAFSWEDYLAEQARDHKIWLDRSIFLVPFFILFIGPMIGALGGTLSVVNTGPLWLFWALDLIVAIFVSVTWIISVRQFLSPKPESAEAHRWLAAIKRFRRRP